MHVLQTSFNLSLDFTKKYKPVLKFFLLGSFKTRGSVSSRPPVNTIDTSALVPAPRINPVWTCIS